MTLEEANRIAQKHIAELVAALAKTEELMMQREQAYTQKAEWYEQLLHEQKAKLERLDPEVRLLSESHNFLEVEVERLERERDYWRSIAASFVDEGRMEQMLAVLEGK